MVPKVISSHEKRPNDDRNVTTILLQT